MSPALVGPWMAGARVRYQDAQNIQLADLAQRDSASRRAAALERANQALQYTLTQQELAYKQQALGEQSRQFNMGYGLDRDKLALQDQQFDANLGYQYADLGLRGDALDFQRQNAAEELQYQYQALAAQRQADNARINAQLQLAQMQQGWEQERAAQLYDLEMNKLSAAQANAQAGLAYNYDELGLRQQQEERLRTQLDWQMQPPTYPSAPDGFSMTQWGYDPSGRQYAQYAPAPQSTAPAFNPFDPTLRSDPWFQGFNIGQNGQPSLTFNRPSDPRPADPSSQFSVLQQQRQALQSRIGDLQQAINSNPQGSPQLQSELQRLQNEQAVIDLQWQTLYGQSYGRSTGTGNPVIDLLNFGLGALGGGGKSSFKYGNYTVTAP